MFMLLRLNMFHLLQAAALNSIGLDIGVPARGWTGEAYQGHIFCDELFIFPFLNDRTPAITRSVALCGESVGRGFRVVAVNAAGNPVSTVKAFKLTSFGFRKSVNTNL